MQMGEFEFILPLTAKIKKFHYLHVSFSALGLVRTVKCCAEAHQQGTVTQEIGGNRPRQTNQRRQQRAQNLCRHIWAAEELNAGWLELAGALLSVSVHALSSELDTNGASVKTNLGPPEHLVTTLPQHTAGKRHKQDSVKAAGWFFHYLRVCFEDGWNQLERNSHPAAELVPHSALWAMQENGVPGWSWKSERQIWTSTTCINYPDMSSAVTLFFLWVSERHFWQTLKNKTSIILNSMAPLKILYLS